MVSGATSLSLVRDELFTTMEEAETCLEHFIVERDNASLLQQAVGNLQQVRGTLNLIELTGAELLAQEVLNQAADIPAGAGEERNAQLTALSNALHVLRRYLENLEAHRQEIPELLLPAINELRHSANQTPLPESFFYTVRLDSERPAGVPANLDASARAEVIRRMRHLFQTGLLAYIREADHQTGLKQMERALTRLDGLFRNLPQGRLYWVAAAAAEAHGDAQLLPRRSRKTLFGKVERELKAVLNEQHEPSKALLKELLYLVALADTQGPLAVQVREAFGLMPLPFTDHMLEEEYQRLAGPGKAVLQSLSSALREELNSLKDMLDLVERGTFEKDSLGTLHSLLAKLSKTLGMVGLNSAGAALNAQLSVVAGWTNEQPPQSQELHKMADALLYVEGVVADFERGERRETRAAVQPGNEADSFAQHQLNEARIVVLDEAQGGLALAKRAITAYLESAGDRIHLANVPFSLHALRGGLWFLGKERAAALVGACADYIQHAMYESPQMPSEQMLETLADALSSLEYYLEGGAEVPENGQSNVLDLASESVRALGMTLET